MKTRDKIIPVRVSEEELKFLTQKAEEIGLKLSTYLRFIALNYEK